ncbi:MAG: O-antigen ligase family protein [Nitrospira sp.]|nr:O-antigen ligase family protein [Nitrospira sp.]HQY58806.1 O-antigen ligase family protein [Nitrospira sp.]HRA95311.1 O-antigen ligase family protein [Nitrospira sp.]
MGKQELGAAKLMGGQIVSMTPSCEEPPFLSGLSASEVGYYFVIFYTVLGGPLRLTVGNIGVGFLMLFLLTLWFVQNAASCGLVLKQAGLALGCGITYLLIQLLVHDESSTQLYVRGFGIWLPALVVVQWLSNQPGFLRRFAFFTVAMGFAMIPFMKISVSAGLYQRIGLESGVGFANPNDLGYWYGFCALYLILAGFSTSVAGSRILYWAFGLVCLYLVTLTLSRSPLIAIAIAIMVASRRLLREGFLLLFLLGGLVYAAIQLGVFDAALKSYGLRAGEETGRTTVWPILIDAFLNSPMVGLGASHAGMFVPDGRFFTPHNGFLLIAVSSGVVPLMFFIAHCIKAAKAAFLSTARNMPDSIYYLPLLTYVLLVVNTSNGTFMAPWAMVSIALPLCVQTCQQHD